MMNVPLVIIFLILEYTNIKQSKKLNEDDKLNSNCGCDIHFNSDICESSDKTKWTQKKTHKQL